MAAIEAISSDEPIRAVVDLWNTWVAVGRINTNLKNNGGAEGEALAREIETELRSVASRAILKSREKLLPFAKEMGSFSYLKTNPAYLSQGAPVSPVDFVCGDVNATMIASTHMVSAIFSSLGLGDNAIKLYGREEGEAFLAEVEKRAKM